MKLTNNPNTGATANQLIIQIIWGDKVMSKIKDQILRDQDIQMKDYFKFMDKMYDVLRPEPRLSKSDIEEMEKSYGNSSKPLVSKTSEIVSFNSSNTAKTIKDAAWEQ